MNAAELMMPDGSPAGAWQCGKCGRVDAGCTQGNRLSSDMNRASAERCCRPLACRVCGKPTGKNWRVMCDPCSDEQSRATEAARFEKAVKVVGPIDGPLYDATADVWHDDLDSVDEWVADDEERTRPTYLWLSKPVGWKPDASGTFGDTVYERFGEDAAESITEAAWAELDAAVTAWWAKHRIVAHEPDYTRCVLVPAATTPTETVS